MKEHVIINKDRTVNVPNSLQRLGVQYDHNVNTIIFDCPRYPDEDPTVDMSKMQIFINYMLPNKKLGASQGVNVEIDPEDNTLIHFSWKITRAITQYKGVLSTLICVKQVNDDGNEVYHWNTVMFQKFTVDEGMECSEVIVEENVDIIASILDSFSGFNSKYDDVLVKYNEMMEVKEQAQKIIEQTSEEQISNLIDQRLGVVENGTY